MRSDLLPLSPDDRDIIRRQPLFANLPAPVFEALIATAKVQAMPARATLFREGNPALDIYIVLDGWLKLYRVTPKGEEAIIALFSRSESVAEAVALVAQNYPASAEAVTECRLLRIPVAPIVHALRERPEIALAMLASISVHMHRLVAEVARLKAGNGLQRMAEFLIDLDGGKQAAQLTLPFEKHVLARHLGMQPESLSRTIAKLKPHGVVVDVRNVAINSWPALHKLRQSH